jgi:hypothetical protein
MLAETITTSPVPQSAPGRLVASAVRIAAEA